MREYKNEIVYKLQFGEVFEGEFQKKGWKKKIFGSTNHLVNEKFSVITEKRDIAIIRLRIPISGRDISHVSQNLIDLD
jgi:hypothetical protein